MVLEVRNQLSLKHSNVMMLNRIVGMMRSFLVWPTYIVFPNLIPTIQMFDVLHRGQTNFLQKKRVKFFWVLFCGICRSISSFTVILLTSLQVIWQWIPEYVLLNAL